MTPSARKLLILIRTTALAGGILFASALEAQTPSYFPLAVGNTWLYRSVSINPNTPTQLDINYNSVTVRSTEKIAGRNYFDVSFLGREVVLRADPSSDVFLYDRSTGSEVPWVPFSLPLGGTFQTGINPCPTQAQITSRTAQVFTDGAGDLENQIEVTLQGSCAGVGATLQYYGPGVGLTYDKEASPAGPVVWRLIYYRAGSTVGTPPEVSFTTSVEAQHYFPGTLLEARLTLRNSGTDPLKLHYPSSQNFDFQILNEQGQIVFTWSSDKTFLAAVRDESLGFGDLNYGVTVPLANLPMGKYIARGFLTTAPIVYQGQVPFEIVPFPKP